MSSADVYQTRDTHWSTRGVERAALELARVAGASPDDALPLVDIGPRPQVRGLVSMLGIRSDSLPSKWIASDDQPWIVLESVPARKELRRRRIRRDRAGLG